MAWTAGSIESTYLYEINRQFDSHLNDLGQEYRKISENIQEWAVSLNFQINKHAREQLDLLQVYFEDRQRVLREKRTEAMNELRILSTQYDHDRINGLLDQCNRLKFELLVRVTFQDQPLQFIQCVTKDHLEQMKKNESTASKTESYTSTAQLQMKDSTLINESRANQTSLTTKFANTNEFSTSRDNSNQNYAVMSNNDIDDKCPICFMIFPLHMQLSDRERHVYGHNL